MQWGVLVGSFFCNLICGDTFCHFIEEGFFVTLFAGMLSAILLVGFLRFYLTCDMRGARREEAMS